MGKRDETKCAAVACKERRNDRFVRLLPSALWSRRREGGQGGIEARERDVRLSCRMQRKLIVYMSYQEMSEIVEWIKQSNDMMRI